MNNNKEPERGMDGLPPEIRDIMKGIEIRPIPHPPREKILGFDRNEVAFVGLLSVVVYLLKKYPLITIGTILFFYLFWSFFTWLGQ